MKQKEKLTLKQAFWSSVLGLSILSSVLGLGIFFGQRAQENAEKKSTEKIINDAYMIGYDHGYNNQAKWKKDSLKTYLMPQKK